MTKHSKNNTASSIFSYAEYKKLDYGTKRQRLGNESMRQFDACSLCLNTARDPMACNEGHLFCKECVYTDLLTQKQDIKRQKEKFEAMRLETEAEKERARSNARERVLLEFEKNQRHLGVGAATITTSGAEGSQNRGTKRKFDFDVSVAESHARVAEEAALCQIEKEQADALRHKLPDFWLPSLTPTYTSTGPPASLDDIKLQVTCRGGHPPHQLTKKNLISVKYVLHEPSGTSREAAASAGKGKVELAICPSCKKSLSNNILSYVSKPCGHVICKTCTDSLVKVAKQCIACDMVLADEDLIELKREGTGFAGGGMAEAAKAGIAFQG